MAQSFSAHNVATQIENTIRGCRPLDLPVPWQNELIFPHFHGLSIFNVAQTITDLFALPSDSPLDPIIWDGEPVDRTIDRVVMIITDGLGYKLLNAFIEDDEDLHNAVNDLTDGRGPVPITSVVPSTTAVALPTLWTAQMPSTHGMLGTILFLRECAVLTNMLAYKGMASAEPPDAISTWGFPAEDFVSLPSLGQLLNTANIPTHLLLDKALLGSGLSKIMHRGIDNRHIHVGLNDIWLRLRDVLKETAGQRCFVNTYWPAVDSLSHLYGMWSPYLRDEVKRQMISMRDVITSPDVSDGRTLVMILADHGHLDISGPIQLDQDKRLKPIHDAMRFPFSGDKRFSQIYLRDGHKQRVFEILQRDFSEHLTWIGPDDALRHGLFGTGPTHLEYFHRVGDLAIIARLGTCLYDSFRDRPPKSAHGGLSDWEMLVPFMWKRI